LEFGSGIDSTTGLKPIFKNALNDGLRAIQRDVPFTAKDTLTIAADSFINALNDALLHHRNGNPRTVEAKRPTRFSLVTPDVAFHRDHRTPIGRCGVVAYALTPHPMGLRCGERI